MSREETLNKLLSSTADAIIEGDQQLANDKWAVAMSLESMTDEEFDSLPSNDESDIA